MPATRADLRARAKARGDFENDSNIDDATWNVWLEQDLRALWRLVERQHPDHFLSGPTTFVLSGTTDTFDLTTLSPLFWKLRGLDFQGGGSATGWVKVPRFTWEERNRAFERAYRVMGNFLRFIPNERAAGTYRAWWIPEPAALATDGTAIDPVVSMYDEFIVLSSAVRGRKRQERDAGDLVAELQALIADIRGSASERDEHEPDRVSDVETAVYEDLVFWRRI